MPHRAVAHAARLDVARVYTGSLPYGVAALPPLLAAVVVHEE